MAQLGELTAWLERVGAGEFAPSFAQRGYTTPQAVARSGLTEDHLRAMGLLRQPAYTSPALCPFSPEARVLPTHP